MLRRLDPQDKHALCKLRNSLLCNNFLPNCLISSPAVSIYLVSILKALPVLLLLRKGPSLLNSHQPKEKLHTHTHTHTPNFIAVINKQDNNGFSFLLKGLRNDIKKSVHGSVLSVHFPVSPIRLKYKEHEKHPRSPTRVIWRISRFFSSTNAPLIFFHFMDNLCAFFLHLKIY